jgi:hypothetical protein
MLLFLAASVSALVLAGAAWRVLTIRHRKRNNRSMRDHLNRISRTSE